MSNYKILKILGTHYSIIDRIYKDNPDLKNQGYEYQKEFLQKMFLVNFNNFSGCMKSLGNVSNDVIYDAEVLQRTWARENNVKYDGNNWQTDIILNQIKFYKPDVLYIYQDIGCIPDSIKKTLKKIFPFIRLIIGYRGFTGRVKELGILDILFVCTTFLRKIYQHAGINTHLIYHSFDEMVLNSISEDLRRFDFTFAGSSGFGYGQSHLSRYCYLFELFKSTNLTAWLYEYHEGIRSCSTNIEFPKKFVSIKPLSEMFPEKCNSSVFGKEMHKILSCSKITFNIHTDVIGDTVGNMRLFEATGAGACLLTDTGSNMHDLFEEDREIITYSSIEECIEKYNYLMEHQNVIAETAIAGRNRCLKDHTLMKRCIEMDTIIRESLKNN